LLLTIDPTHKIFENEALLGKIRYVFDYVFKIEQFFGKDFV